MGAIDLAMAVLGAGTTIIGGIVWLVRLEGRINTETALREAMR